MSVSSITTNFDLQHVTKICVLCEATPYLKTCGIKKIVGCFVTVLEITWFAPVAYRGVVGWGVQPPHPRNSEVLTKLHLIAN